MMDVGQELRFLRKKKGWSQDALALASGVSRATIANLELRKHSGTYIVYEMLFNALGYEFVLIPCEK